MFSRFTKNKNINQAVSLYLTMLFGVVLGFGVSLINTRFLDVDSYGKFKFIQQLFTFLATVMVFGFSYSTGRLVALYENRDKKEGLVSVTVWINLVIVLVTTFVVLFLSFFVDDWFDTKISHYLAWCSPFVFVTVFTRVLENLFEGLNQIGRLSILRIGPRFFYVVVSLISICFFKLTLERVLLLHWGVGSLIILYFLLSFRISRFGFKKFFTDIWIENKSNGFPVYIGSLSSVASGQLIGIFLGYHADMAMVGFYSLSLIVSAPLQFIPSVLGTTFFKTFANRTHIPLRVFMATLSVTAVTLLVYWLLIEKILVLAYSKEYASAVPFAKVLSVGMVFHGLGNFFNRFLGAHGKGKNLRNGSFLTGGVIIVGCFFVIPHTGAMSAAYVKAFSSVVYFFSMYAYYKQYQRTLTNRSKF